MTMVCDLKETDLAATVVSWLKDQHWDVYQEVQMRRGDAIADIVAVQGDTSWVIECKRSLTFAVIEQAIHWKPFARFASVAVPYAKGKGRWLAERTCGAHGVGYLSVRDDDVNVVISPQINRRLIWNITEHLTEQQRDYAPAGSRGGSHWTPFKQTCDSLRRYLKDHDGATMKEVMANIDHHYHRDTTAKACLLKWAERGKIRGVRAERDGRRIRLFLSGATS